MRISDWSSDVCSSDLISPQETRSVEVQDRIGQECTHFSVTLADDVAQCDRHGLTVDRCLHVTRLDVWGVNPTDGVGNIRSADIAAAAQNVMPVELVGLCCTCSGWRSVRGGAIGGG